MISNINLFYLYYNRTTKSGGLPNLSYIKRKPEPLGTEFKVATDGLSGMMAWLEIQEGKERMAKKDFFIELGATAGCVMRGVKNGEKYESESDNNESTKKDLWLGDSWFGSVKACASVGRAGHHCCFVVKTGHGRSPKKFLEEKMKDMPGGTWIVLEGRASKEGVDLVTLGYKYNKKKVLTFVYTKGAGSSAPGKPYEARFPDKFGNVCIRHVGRPEIVSTYFEFSNQTDMHNQSRQYDLGLEKRWVTQDPYFRLYTTMLGMTVVDCWKLMRSKLKVKKRYPLLDFADCLALELCKEADTLEKEESRVSRSGLVVNTTYSLEEDTHISSLSSPKGCSHHTMEFLTSGQLRCCWCSRVHLVERKTTMKCKECKVGFCRDRSGRNCWSHHVALGGVPKQPPRGTLKRKAFEVDEH